MWNAITDRNHNQQIVQHGMLSPISVALPKKIDFASSRKLDEILRVLDSKESEEESNRRVKILSRLNDLVKEWILEMTLLKQSPQDEANLVGGKIYTFGSYRLGVHSKGADIDALCVAPRHIDRVEYFTKFFEKLKTCPDVTELRSLEGAFVPIIKMRFGGIEIDLLFARLAYKSIPEDLNLQDDVILKNLHVHCVRSLNGYRVTDEILRLVPNIDVFRAALRAIRLWAKRNGIYSNILGYLGGVSWAMLVVRICQLWPNAVASTIVHKFFQVFSTWEWPKPVLLKETIEPSNLDFPVWNPKKNIADRSHLMPIITPCYPQQNSTYNVTKSTRAIICRAFVDGFRISEEIFFGRAKWTLLFERPNFFMKYKHFLLVIATSGTPEDYLKWCGLVESKLRQLVSMLERNALIELAHVNTEIFKLRDLTEEDGKEVPNSVWVVGLKFHKTVSGSIDLTKDIQDFTYAVMKRALTTNMFKEKMAIKVRYVKRKGLGTYLSDEIIKRDRSLFEIMAPIPENSATILLRKRTLEENSSANAANAGRVNRNPFRKVNNNTPDTKCKPNNSAPSPTTVPDTAVVPEAPQSRPQSRVSSASPSESPTMTNNGQNHSPPPDEIINLSSTDDETEPDAVVIDDEDEDVGVATKFKRRRVSSGK